MMALCTCTGVHELCKLAIGKLLMTNTLTSCASFGMACYLVCDARDQEDTNHEDANMLRTRWRSD